MAGSSPVLISRKFTSWGFGGENSGKYSPCRRNVLRKIFFSYYIYLIRFLDFFGEKEIVEKIWKEIL